MDADSFQALSSALISKLPCEVVMELIERGCGGVNAYGECQLTSPHGTAVECTVTPLILASYHGSVEVVNRLLKDSALVNAMGDCKAQCVGCHKNAQAIHWAAARGHVPVVKALISYSATVNALTKEKWTPLHLAAEVGHLEVGHLEVARLLLSSRADVHLATDSGCGLDSCIGFQTSWTALHFAAVGGHTQVVELLIANQARLNTAANKNTALHLASLNGDIGVVKALLTASHKAQADPINWRTQPCITEPVRLEQSVVRRCDSWEPLWKDRTVNSSPTRLH